jgi:hypothetical protein
MVNEDLQFSLPPTKQDFGGVLALSPTPKADIAASASRRMSQDSFKPIAKTAPDVTDLSTLH